HFSELVPRLSDFPQMVKKPPPDWASVGQGSISGCRQMILLETTKKTRFPVGRSARYANHLLKLVSHFFTPSSTNSSLALPYCFGTSSEFLDGLTHAQ